MEYSGTKRDLDSLSYETSKRRKTADPSGPSKVLHVRGLPPYTTEAELISLCNPYGIVQKTLLLNAKQQAFVQMDSIDSAANLVQRLASSPASIRGKPIYFQYSNRTEVKTGDGSGGGGGGGPFDEKTGQSQTPNAILIVSVLNCRVPVTLENIHQVFKPYGEVLKIVTFVKDSAFKALVQMGTVEQAINAKILLEGKDMFQGCCHLGIGFSKLQELKVTANGPRSRDFQLPDYSGGSGSFEGGHQQGYQAPFGGGGPYFDKGYGGSGGGGGGSGFVSPSFTDSKGCVLLVNNLTSEKIDCDKLFILFGVYGDVLRVKILFNKRDTAMIQFATPQQAQTAQIHLNHLFLHTKEINVNQSKHTEVALPRSESEPETASLTKDFTGSPIHRFRHRGARTTKNINPPSQVLHISNLHDTCTEEELRKLFGAEQSTPPVVQFFSNNRKMAYVKMESVHDAVLALMRLHNFKLADKYMRISFSHKDPATINNSDASESASASGGI